MDVRLPESREKEIFFELLRRPDAGAVSANLEDPTAERYGVSMETLENIRRKGMARDWPPLD